MNRAILEVSLKAFSCSSEQSIRDVCSRIHRQWKRLIDQAAGVSILIWASDGSEILDYRGNLEDTFEWNKYIGVANSSIYGKLPDLPEEQISMHRLPRLFREHPPERTYQDLKEITETLRSVFSEGGRECRIGATFDPGPEFAKSSFKYERHREICQAGTLAAKSFVCCYAELNPDSTAYAGFPEGIKPGTSFGTFFGRQTTFFCRDLGFDYIWFSNGFGFGLETWGVTGAVFDGEIFTPEECGAVREKIFLFWKDFRTECPDLPVETRGTNLSTGMDLSSDAVHLREIYRDVSGLTPPVNSPWAALNGDFGMEIAGWMSHIAELPPDENYPFRFYAHDPWFTTTPWIDRYGRNPHDIYLPMSITRIRKNGTLSNPNSLAILSVDDSYGNMPEHVPDEIVPHLLEGARTAPDEPGPMIWLYPFDEYHDMTFSGTGIDEVFFGDWFMRTAINTGFPLNTVVSSGNIEAALRESISAEDIIITPTAISRNKTAMNALKGFISRGGRTLFYGPVRDPQLMSLLGLAAGDPVSGELTADIRGRKALIHHEPLYCAGPIDNILSGSTDTRVIASAEDRPLAISRDSHIAWVRGTNSFTLRKNARYITMLDREKYFYSEELMRDALAELGYDGRFEKFSMSQPDPVLTFKKHANAVYLSAYVPDLTVEEHLSVPEGAPVCTETECIVTGNVSRCRLPKAAHHECRVFVENSAPSVIKVREHPVDLPGFRRRLLVTGLKNATLRIRPEAGYKSVTTVLLNPGGAPYAVGDFLKPVEDDNSYWGTVYTFRDVTGPVMISWRNKQ